MLQGEQSLHWPIAQQQREQQERQEKKEQKPGTTTTTDGEGVPELPRAGRR